MPPRTPARSNVPYQSTSVNVPTGGSLVLSPELHRQRSVPYNQYRYTQIPTNNVSGTHTHTHTHTYIQTASGLITGTTYTSYGLVTVSIILHCSDQMTPAFRFIHCQIGRWNGGRHQRSRHPPCEYHTRETNDATRRLNQFGSRSKSQVGPVPVDINSQWRESW